MFGKRRDKQDGLDDPFASPKPPPPYSGPLVGASTPPESGPSNTPPKPLYAGDGLDSAPGVGDEAERVSDEQFASNLDADLNAAQAAPEPEPEPERAGSSGPGAQPVPTPAKAQRGLSKDGDQMLGLLSTIEAQLGELQRLKADRESLIGDVEQAREELESQRALLDERERSVASLESEARENQRITEGMLADAQKRGAELDQAQEELRRERERVEGLEKALQEREAELGKQDEQVRQRLAELEARERDSEQQEAALREQLAGEYEARLGEVQEALDEARSQIDSLRVELDERSAEVERAREEGRQQLDQRERALREEFESRLEGERQGVDEETERLQRELDEARRAHEQAGTERDELASKRAEAESRAEELSKRAERLAADLDEQASNRGSAEAQAEELRGQVEQLTAELEEARKSASELGEAGAGLEQAEARASELESELAKTRDRLAEAGKHLSEAQERASEAEERVKTLAAELESKAPEPGAAPASAGVDPAELAKRDRVIELLKSKLDQTAARCKQLDEQLAAGGNAGGAPQKASHDALQQKLLARQQELDVIAHKLSAREQALKQREAAGAPAKSLSPMGAGTDDEREALRKETEQLYLQREAVAEARAAVDRKAKKVAAKAAKSKAINLVLSGVVTMGILAFFSWYIASEIVRPVHVASVELGVDPQARGLSEKQLAAWQSYHEALLDDPQFHELAARRLKARGYTEFGSPSDVREMVSSGVVASESSADGRLTLLYTSPGPDRTVRVLETFSGALSSFANETRDHRYDSTATATISPASADPTPLEDPRLNLFATIFGGACAFALFASVILWRRISRDIGDFEDRLSDELQISGPATEGGASSEGRRLMF